MVHESLKGADLVAAVFKKLGFIVLPEPKSYRSDIIQAVRLNNPHLIQKVCQSFQNSSPIDSFLNVIPSPMSGYDSNLLMSGGTFIEGRIWIGNKSMSAGRSGEQAAQGLTQSLHNLGIKTERLKNWNSCKSG